jgi:hypothetical protein
MNRRTCVTLAVVALCLGVGGCQAVFGPSESTPAQPVTPAPVPTTETPAPTPPPNGRALGGVWLGQWSEFEPESAAAYRDVQRTCERPPARVVHLQLGALLTDNGTRSGIETMWQFLSPDTRRSFGSVERYVETVRTRYRPLLEADSVTHRPVERNGRVAVQPFRVNDDGSTTTYHWRVERQRTSSGEECWLTTAIAEAPGETM